MRRSASRNWLTCVCAAALAAAPLGGLAQPSGAPADPNEVVTTVDALTVIGTINVGQGATYYLPTELTITAHDARQAGIDARQNFQQCHQNGRPQHREDLGDFDLEALYYTQAQANLEVWRTGEAARIATEAALNARANVISGAGTQTQANVAELARQEAVRNLQAAQAAAREAGYRVSDLQQMAMEYVSGNVAAVQDLEAGKYIMDCQATGNGTIPVTANSPGEALHCQRTDMWGNPKGEGMRQFQPMVQQRTADRARGNGFSLYVPREFADLKLMEVSAHQGEEKGRPFLRVVGKIVNQRKTAIAVPPLWVAAVDRFGTELQAQQLDAPRGTPKIPAGSSVPFIYVFIPMPDSTARANVTFAPLHRQSGELTAELFCPTVFEEF